MTPGSEGNSWKLQDSSCGSSSSVIPQQELAVVRSSPHPPLEFLFSPYRLLKNSVT